MHPNISINSLCIQAPTLAANIDLIARIGVSAISPGVEEVRATGVVMANRLLHDAGLSVATLTHRAFGFITADETAREVERLNQSIDLAAGIGASSITMTTGGRGSLSWSDAKTRFANAISPCAAYAIQAGVTLAVEPTSHLYADASIAHRLRDLVEICTDADIGLGIDLFACWFDSDIEAAITAAVPRCQLVQVSDYVTGDRALPCRAMPGDGMAQTKRLVRHIVACGYKGMFDLEVIGPRIESEGPESALRRGADQLSSYLQTPS